MVLDELPVLNEASKRCQPCPRPHHDDGTAGAVGEAQAGVPDEDGEAGLGGGAIGRAALLLQPLEPGGGHALISAASAGLILH